MLKLTQFLSPILGNVSQFATETWKLLELTTMPKYPFCLHVIYYPGKNIFHKVKK